jgi:hypothetical protein
MVTYIPTGASDPVALQPVSTYCPAMDTAPATLAYTTHATHKSKVHVTEGLIRSLVPHCRMPITAAFETRRVEHVNGALVQAPEATPEGTCAFDIDIADLLVGDMRLQHRFTHHAILGAPSALLEATLTISSTIFTPLGMPALETAPESALCAFLPPGLHDRLVPLVLRFDKAEDLPDQPATVAALSEQCRPCYLRFRLPTQPTWTVVHANTDALVWSAPTRPVDPFDPPLCKRTLHIGAAYVLLAADLNLPRFLDECTCTPLVVEVRDRDAKPALLSLTLPADDPPEPLVTQVAVTGAAIEKNSNGMVRCAPALVHCWHTNALQLVLVWFSGSWQQ